MSDAFLPMITKFEVDSFDKSMSDLHCPLKLTISHTLSNDLSYTSNTNTDNPVVTDELNRNDIPDIRFKWDNVKAKVFMESFNDVNLITLKSALLELEDNHCQSDVDNFCKRLGKVFIDQATDIGACSEKNNNDLPNEQSKLKKVLKPWFDKDCHILRTEYYKVKNHLKRIKDPDLVSKMKAESKNTRSL